MDSELPDIEQLQAQVEEGYPITQAEASAIAHNESDMTHRGPIKGGRAAIAQGLHDRRENFLRVAGEVARKPSDQITKEDAVRIQHFEVRSALQLSTLSATEKSECEVRRPPSQ